MTTLRRCAGAWALLAALFLITSVGRAGDEALPPLSLIPKPMHVERKEGAFILDKHTVILVQKDSADAASVGSLLAERLNHSTGLGIAVSPADGAALAHNAIVLTTKTAEGALGAEGYRLEVGPEGIIITAAEGAGLFYGVQTLLQLLPPQVFSPVKVEQPVAWTVPAVQIEDRPRFPWRGLMVDVCRHFFTKEEIKSFIDLMAQHKFNVFHWKLTEDQAWRIEIKRYPKLTEVGAWRKDIGFGHDPKSSTAYGPDGRYGGFYTQDDVREIVAYAKARHITVIPEIEMPGHSFAALVSYPELGCTGGPYSIDMEVKSGIYGDVFCAGSEGTFTFLENVLTEVLDLFPSKMIHIGGDEVPFPRVAWKNCPKCQARIQQEGLQDEKGLQSCFVGRIEKFLNARGRRLIGWEEITEGGLSPTAAVMGWRRQCAVGIAAARAGHDVVMTPQAYLYINRFVAPPGTVVKSPEHRLSPLTLDRVYSYEPIPADFPADKAAHFLGAEGSMCSERIPNYSQLQFLAYPRACAVAELTWTDPKQKDFADFQQRLDAHLERLNLQGVNYYTPQASSPGDKP